MVIDIRVFRRRLPDCIFHWPVTHEYDDPLVIRETLESIDDGFYASPCRQPPLVKKNKGALGYTQRRSENIGLWQRRERRAVKHQRRLRYAVHADVFVGDGFADSHGGVCVSDPEAFHDALYADFPARLVGDVIDFELMSVVDHTRALTAE
ncbi:hypothetical protein D3C72_1936650 [compost metagenome]